MKDLKCDYCLGVQGICTECLACFYDHCECDPCAHNKMRNEDCVFCLRGIDARPDIIYGADEVLEEAIKELEYGGEA